MSPPLSLSFLYTVLTDYLEAQRASILNLHVKKMVCTTNADIAYHLKLRGPHHRRSKLEEGDIIGFFENPQSGETEIELLSDENSGKCRMAGVISRSAYLCGNTPDSDKGMFVIIVVVIVVCLSVCLYKHERL